jgi:hypothetical protein
MSICLGCSLCGLWFVQRRCDADPIVLLQAPEEGQGSLKIANDLDDVLTFYIHIFLGI